MKTLTKSLTCSQMVVILAGPQAKPPDFLPFQVLSATYKQQVTKELVGCLYRYALQRHDTVQYGAEMILTLLPPRTLTQCIVISLGKDSKFYNVSKKWNSLSYFNYAELWSI